MIEKLTKKTNQTRMSREDLLSYFGEGIHTAFRKASCSTHANRAWRAISNIPEDEWHYILEFIFQGVQRVVWKKEDVR